MYAKTETKFPFVYVALYAKKWYERSDNIFKDLAVCLGKDYEIYSDDDIARLIVSNTLPFVHDSFDLIRNISPQECWKCGYYTKDHTWIKDHEKLPSYDYWTAVVIAHLSIISVLEKSKIKGLSLDTSLSPSGEEGWQRVTRKIAREINLPLRKKSKT